jgi:hypothetical protein
LLVLERVRAQQIQIWGGLVVLLVVEQSLLVAEDHVLLAVVAIK